MKKALLGLMVATLLVPLIAGAAVFRGNQNYSLSQSERVDGNLYTAGGTVSILGAVNGDTVAAGGMVTVSGNTSQDVLVGGGNITINGTVGGDARVAGGNISIAGTIANDLVVAGGQISIQSNVGGDTFVAGGNVVLNGPVRGKLVVRGGNVTINSAINGPVDIQADSVTIGSSAVLNQGLTYHSPNQARIENGSRINGNVNYIPITGRAGSNILVSIVVKLAMLFVSALVLGLVLKKLSFVVALNSKGGFWWNVLRGFIFLIATPIACIILFITVVGLPIGLALLLSYIVMLILSYIFTTVLAGVLINKWVFKRPDYPVNWLTILIGSVAVLILSIIPVVGWLVNLILMLAVLGTFFKHSSDWIIKRG